ncbi:Crp/Fnr family transcriptional regulator [Leptotrichia sp. oral taxon 417]|jgi:transcription regulator, CRP family|uniref:Crp/Fnr family transcriptional regulator n=1 Tax=Leptotrichia sp. oral taxon 417 TaxID=712365 RepID=UPI0015B9023D|nr:Crp/Fnr family transcriptional regulator [Leptotrichia sp. oral taxon 417]NWO28127.1 Crp/Fnr family transcriptional regulator [Leptotrichia sp. oral taxon 417]
MKIKDLSLFLTKVSLFKGLNPDKIAKCLTEADFKIKEYKKNEIVFFRGDILKKIIIIVKGTARGEMQKFNGDTIVINQMKAGEVLASAFLFGKNNVFPVDLIALENSEFLFLDKEKYLDLIQSDKRLLLNFIREISNKSQYLSKRIWFNFTHKTIEEKVLSYIKENAQDDKIKFLPSISALAKKFEVTRPALSREISSLCKRKILKKIENNVYIINFSNFFQKNV